jgi:hypothetical protein
VLTPAIASGGVGSKLIDNTTNTSRFSGSKFKSIAPWVNVLAADSATPNPIGTTEDDAFNPLGITAMVTKSAYKLTLEYWQSYLLRGFACESAILD